MGATADAVAAKAVLRRTGFGEGEVLLERLGWRCGGHHKQVVRLQRHDDRRQVLQGIEGRLLENGGQLDQHRVVDQHRVAVCGRLDHRLCADDSRCARPVVNDYRLAPRLLQLLTNHARHRIRCAARRIRHYKFDRPARIGGLRRGRRQCPGAQGEQRKCCRLKCTFAQRHGDVSSCRLGGGGNGQVVHCASADKMRSRRCFSAGTRS